MTERRKHPRTLNVGTRAAVLLPDDAKATFVVEDISASGARLSGELAVPVATRVKIMFNVEGLPITLAADVVRSAARDNGPVELAVEFRDVPDAVRDKIQSFVLRQSTPIAPPGVAVPARAEDED